MIKPTVGRVVWYHPAASDPVLGPWASPAATQPLAAIVVYVWSDTLVNLAVFDPNGNQFGRTSVPLYQGEAPGAPSGAFAEWMPFQKGQAAKTEELEKKPN